MIQLIELLIKLLTNPSELAKRIKTNVRKLSKVFNTIDSLAPVVLYSTNNIQFIYIYITCLLSGRRLHIIPADIAPSEAWRIIFEINGITVISNDLFRLEINTKYWAAYENYLVQVYLTSEEGFFPSYSNLGDQTVQLLKETFEKDTEWYIESPKYDMPVITLYTMAREKFYKVLESTFTYNEINKELNFFIKCFAEYDVTIDRSAIFISELQYSRNAVLAFLYPLVTNKHELLGIQNGIFNITPNPYIQLKPQQIITTTGRVESYYKMAKLSFLEGRWLSNLFRYYPASKIVLNRIKIAFLRLLGSPKHIVIVSGTSNYMLYEIIQQSDIPIDVVIYSDDRKNWMYWPHKSNEPIGNGENMPTQQELYFSQIESMIDELNIVEDAKVIKYNDKLYLCVKPSEDCTPEWSTDDIISALNIFVEKFNSLAILGKIDGVRISHLPFEKDSEGRYKQNMHQILSPHEV